MNIEKIEIYKNSSQKIHYNLMNSLFVNITFTSCCVMTDEEKLRAYNEIIDTFKQSI